MIRFLRAAARGVRAEYAGSGWQTYFGNMNWANRVSPSHAGKAVSARTSLEVSAVWACVRKTAEMISTLPVDHYRKGSGDSRERLDDDLAEIIKDSPNPEQTAPEFWEGMVAQTTLQGNACAERLYMGSRLVGLRPLLSCRPERRPDGTIRYAVTDRGKTEFMPADKVFHLRGFGAGDGLGMSTVRYGANSIGAAMAADETAGKVFSNAAMPSGILQSEQTLNPDQRAQLQVLMDAYSGSSKAGKMMVLEAGLKYQQLQMNPEDAQLLETRRFGVEDVCRWFGVPPIVIGHAAEGQTMWGSGVEAILLAWRTLGINPFLIRIEKRIRKDLVPVQRRRTHYVEYNREAMIQMDSKAKGELMLRQAMSGTTTANERRAKLNLPRSDEPFADSLTIQTSLQPLELLGKDDT